MAFAQTTGNHEYWYDPNKKEFVLTLFKTGEDGRDKSYLVKPDNIVKAASMLDEYDDEDFSLYDMLKFLKEHNALEDYNDVAKELAERYSDQSPVWLDKGSISDTLGLLKDPHGNMMEKAKEDMQSIIDDFARYGASVTNASDITSAINRGNRLLNTHSGLVKNNHGVFFPDGKIPSDALDDYEEDSNSENYWTLEELKEMDVSPEEWKEWKQQLSENILTDKRKTNEMFKKSNERYRGADGNYDVAKAMNSIFGE